LIHRFENSFYKENISLNISEYLCAIFNIHFVNLYILSFHLVTGYTLLISDIDELYINKNVFIYHVHFINYQNVYGINMFNILFNMNILYLDFIHDSTIDKMI
jgi:hypothetical protein